MTGDTAGARAWRSLRTSLAATRDRLRDATTASPSRFAVGIFLALILLFTALFSLPAASADGRVTPFADALHQQIPPFAHWGTEYAVVPYKPRIQSFSQDAREQVPYTIVGAVDGTVLTYDPSRPRDAPATLQAGESASFFTDDVFVVKSQDAEHPFHVNVYMTGAAYPGISAGGGETLGDPEFVNVPPADQFLDRYVFFTDFTYDETTLTIVRRKTAKGFAPVELECAGEITGFMPLGSGGEYEFAWVQLTAAYRGKTFPKGTCGYGRQEAHSTGPFAVTVWGISPYASYGYVGGTGLRPIHQAPPPRVD